MKGQNHTFNIDDRLPVDNEEVALLAMRSHNGAWWLPILEKAFAKFNVNYLNMDGGFEA
jgi:hypothetical protein